MTRALSLTCLALIALGGSAWARPSIAVLGLEVVDPTGTPTKEDTVVAKQLTDGLRARAQVSNGPYALAPGSDKELIDEKLVNSCDSEAATCMASIAAQMGADMLLYGHLQKEKSGRAYEVTLKLLDVHRKVVEKSSNQLIPLSQANETSLKVWSKTLYANLTGQQSTGVLVVKVSNADRGTILINGDEKGNITNGVGQVSGLSEGTYKLAVESQGYRRYEQEVSVHAGETETVPVRLEKPDEGGNVIEPPPGGGIIETTTASGNPTWRKVFYASVAVGLGAGGWWVYSAKKVNDYQQLECENGYYQSVSNPPVTCTNVHAPTISESKLASRGDHWSTQTYVAGGVVAGAVVLGGLAFYEGFIAKHDGGPSEHASRGHRVRRERFVVTPVVSPQGGGVTMMLSW